MPSFSEAMGVIVTFIVLSTASGHGDVVWKAIAGFRKVALTNARQDFGCPSIFNKNACNSMTPNGTGSWMSAQAGRQSRDFRFYL